MAAEGSSASKGKTPPHKPSVVIERYAPVIIGIPFLCLVVVTGVYLGAYNNGSSSSNSTTCPSCSNENNGIKNSSDSITNSSSSSSTQSPPDVVTDPALMGAPADDNPDPSDGISSNTDSKEMSAAEVIQKEVKEIIQAKSLIEQSKEKLSSENTRLQTSKTQQESALVQVQNENTAIQKEIHEYSTMYGITEISCEISGSLATETRPYKRRRRDVIDHTRKKRSTAADPYLYDMNLQVSFPRGGPVSSKGYLYSTGHYQDNLKPKFSTYVKDESHRTKLGDITDLPLVDRYHFPIAIADSMTFEVWDRDPGQADVAIAYFLFSRNDILQCARDGTTSTLQGVDQATKTNPVDVHCSMSCVVITS
eukprot:Nk52_evm8s160 gene=Nk52_evmTU8s160